MLVLLKMLVGAINGELVVKGLSSPINPRQCPSTGDSPLIEGGCSGDSCWSCAVALAEVVLFVAFTICFAARLLLQFEF